MAHSKAGLVVITIWKLYDSYNGRFRIRKCSPEPPFRKEMYGLMGVLRIPSGLGSYASVEDVTPDAAQTSSIVT